MTNQKERIVVAVDGLSATGKTTLARMLANQLDFCCLHTGLLYRAVAFLVMSSSIKDLQNTPEIMLLLAQHKIEPCDGRVQDSAVLIDGKCISQELKSVQVSEMTSKLSALPEVRQALFEMQRNAFAGKNIVAEGRDMGTVIFPDAQVKFFVEASPIVRAQRRLQELQQAKVDSEANQLDLLEKSIEKEIQERDQRDQSRLISPAIPAQDAIVIDNSSETLTQVVEKMYVPCAKLVGCTRIL